MNKNNIKKRHISVTLDESLIKELDQVKGFCPRSTYVNHILEVFLKIKTEDRRLNELHNLLQK